MSTVGHGTLKGQAEAYEVMVADALHTGLDTAKDVPLRRFVEVRHEASADRVAMARRRSSLVLGAYTCFVYTLTSAFVL